METLENKHTSHSLMLRIRKFENLHIVFWLVKDSCWMLQLKPAGTLMIFPTVYIAFYIMWRTRRTREFFINAAILCWICANSFWMLMEFFNGDRLRYYAAIPFSLGLLLVGIYYAGRWSSQGIGGLPGGPPDEPEQP